MKTKLSIQPTKPSRSSILNPAMAGKPRSSVIFGREIIHLPTTTSTNDEIERLTLKRELQAPEGIVVWADEQTRGRGRMGREWKAPHGKDLLFSVLVRPQWSVEKMTRLTVLAAVAVARVVSARVEGGRPRSTPAATIKWPNDVLLEGKKVAGILVETRKTPSIKPQTSGKLQDLNPNSEATTLEDSRLEASLRLEDCSLKFFSILGIGINVNSTTRNFPPELRKTATSLRGALKASKTIDREELLRELLAELDAQYVRAQKNFSAVADEWAHRCATIGKFVAVNVGNRRIEGTAHRLDDDGALIIRTETGRQERIVGGDVLLEKNHE